MKNTGKSAAVFSGRASSKAPSKDSPALPSPEELVWKTAAACLENPEDIKECVNDTFLEFYLHNGRYDPEKGSYAAFLRTIAHRKAVSMYRKNRKISGQADMANPADMADPSGMEEAPF